MEGACAPFVGLFFSLFECILFPIVTLPVFSYAYGVLPSMRQIVLDTETTGLKVEAGHRLIEIAGVELINRKFTGRHYHQYLCPQREIDPEAFAVHGISAEFLADKPLFAQVSAELLSFIQDAELIIHNAPFDVGFLNSELRNAGVSQPISQICTIVDTLVLAKKKHPGQRNNLDALCKRYRIDNSARDLHGALLDAQLLARVYLAMTGGQTSLWEELEGSEPTEQAVVLERLDHAVSLPLSIVYADSEELGAHHEFLQRIGQLNKESALIW